MCITQHSLTIASSTNLNESIHIVRDDNDHFQMLIQHIFNQEGFKRCLYHSDLCTVSKCSSCYASYYFLNLNSVKQVTGPLLARREIPDFWDTVYDLQVSGSHYQFPGDKAVTNNYNLFNQLIYCFFYQLINQISFLI